MAVKSTQKASSGRKNRFAKVVFTSKYRPRAFDHRGTVFIWSELTEKQINELAGDPQFTLFTFR
jgi:hypothetical protein